MQSFNESTPLITLKRLFPAFSSCVNLHSSLVKPPLTQEQLEEMITKEASNEASATAHSDLKQFCSALDLSVSDFLNDINAAFADWLSAEISVESFAILLKECRSIDKQNHTSSLVLIDVREEWEHELVKFPNSVRFTPANAQEILKNASSVSNVIIYCHHGVRSLYAATYFRDQGVPQARSLRGGIDSYSVQIDGSFRRY